MSAKQIWSAVSYLARNMFIYPTISGCILLNSCASYKAEPLEDFTQKNQEQEAQQ